MGMETPSAASLGSAPSAQNLTPTAIVARPSGQGPRGPVLRISLSRRPQPKPDDLAAAQNAAVDAAAHAATSAAKEERKSAAAESAVSANPLLAQKSRKGRLTQADTPSDSVANAPSTDKNATTLRIPASTSAGAQDRSSADFVSVSHASHAVPAMQTTGSAQASDDMSSISDDEEDDASEDDDDDEQDSEDDDDASAGSDTAADAASVSRSRTKTNARSAKSERSGQSASNEASGRSRHRKRSSRPRRRRPGLNPDDPLPRIELGPLPKATFKLSAPSALVAAALAQQQQQQQLQEQQERTQQLLQQQRRVARHRRSRSPSVAAETMSGDADFIAGQKENKRRRKSGRSSFVVDPEMSVYPGMPFAASLMPAGISASMFAQFQQQQSLALKMQLQMQMAANASATPSTHISSANASAESASSSGMDALHQDPNTSMASMPFSNASDLYASSQFVSAALDTTGTYHDNHIDQDASALDDPVSIAAMAAMAAIGCASPAQINTDSSFDSSFHLASDTLPSAVSASMPNDLLTASTHAELLTTTGVADASQMASAAHSMHPALNESMSFPGMLTPEFAAAAMAAGVHPFNMSMMGMHPMIQSSLISQSASTHDENELPHKPVSSVERRDKKLGGNGTLKLEAGDSQFHLKQPNKAAADLMHAFAADAAASMDKNLVDGGDTNASAAAAAEPSHIGNGDKDNAVSDAGGDDDDEDDEFDDDTTHAASAAGGSSISPTASDPSSAAMFPNGYRKHKRLGMVRGEKMYRCPRPMCTKIYKNRNGLKYHMARGVCSLMDGTKINNVYAPLPPELINWAVVVVPQGSKSKNAHEAIPNAAAGLVGGFDPLLMNANPAAVAMAAAAAGFNPSMSAAASVLDPAQPMLDGGMPQPSS